MSEFCPGLPVEVGNIENALGRLWEDSADNQTRASLLNLVIYCESRDKAEANTSLLAEIAGRHACRAILIFAEPGAEPRPPEAWIAAHCRKVGQRELCSERITFRIRGNPIENLPGIVFSHLDSDLPLVLWWQGPLPCPSPDRLFAQVDRLVFDSASWEKPEEELRKILKLKSQTNSPVLADLNWTRVLWVRFAIAGLFDHATALEHLPTISSVRLTHAPGYEMSALLLVGWLAARFGWSPTPETLVFRRPDGGRACCALESGGDEPVSRCVFESGEVELAITLSGQAFLATISGAACDAAPRAFGVPRESLADIVVAELSRGGRHGNYRRALEILSHWMGRGGETGTISR